MAHPPELAPIVQSPPRFSRLVLALGIASTLGLVHAAAVAVMRAPAPVATPTIAVPPPIIVTVEKAVPAAVAPPVAIAPADPLGCGGPAAPDDALDDALGRAVDPADVSDEGGPEAPPRIAAATSAPQIAVLFGSALWVSDDDGRSFRRVLAERAIEHVAITPDGTIFAHEAERLAVRAPSGAIAWRTLSFARCEPGARCDRRIATNGAELVGFIDDVVATSLDRGRTWKVVRDPDVAWSDHRGELFTWRGALYQLSHYADMCGVDDTYVFRLDAQRRIAHDIFHNYASTGEPVLRASTDVDPTWTWTERCWSDGDTVERCPRQIGARRELLQAAVLAPREGGRTLAVFGGSLVELCARGARQVYRAFPFSSIAAVDRAGRALVIKGTTLLRWSAAHGWRRLKTFTPVVAPAPE